MPSSSPAQARLMAGVAHSKSFAGKVGIPQKVGKDFNKADRFNNTDAIQDKPPRRHARRDQGLTRRKPF